MNKRYILKSNEEISLLVKNRQSVGNAYFAIYYKKEELKTPKIAISVSKKLGCSPVRNHEKRVIREIVRNNFLVDSFNLKLLIVIKAKSLELSFEEKTKVLKQLFNKIKENK